MVLYRNRLVFGVIGRVFSIIAKVIYRIIKLFNLQFTFLVLVAGLFLLIFGAFNNKTLLVCFYVVLTLSVLGALYFSFTKTFYKKKKPKKEIGDVGDYDEREKEEKSEKVKPERSYTERETEPEQEIKIEKPKYYRVKQNPNYIMAEYSDRYELYYKTVNGLKKIRTDYKN